MEEDVRKFKNRPKRSGAVNKLNQNHKGANEANRQLEEKLL